MAKVYAPNTNYNGLCAGIGFVNGVGECTDPHLLDWFKEKGYTVIDSEPEMTVDELKCLAGKMGFQLIPNETPVDNTGEKTLADMTVKELKAFAAEHNVELKHGSKAEIVQQIKDALAVESSNPATEPENAPDNPPVDNLDDEDEDEPEDEDEDEDE
jgi:hypothetical protein